jgi:Tn3 transposase DDE domain
VVRTAFLLQYLSAAELRQTIQATTNKSEAFNRFVQWLFFGGEGIITALAHLSPYLTAHVNRFGSYALNFDRQVPSPDYSVGLGAVAG